MTYVIHYSPSSNLTATPSPTSEGSWASAHSLTKNPRAKPCPSDHTSILQVSSTKASTKLRQWMSHGGDSSSNDGTGQQASCHVAPVVSAAPHLDCILLVLVGLTCVVPGAPDDPRMI